MWPLCGCGLYFLNPEKPFQPTTATVHCDAKIVFCLLIVYALPIILPYLCKHVSVCHVPSANRDREYHSMPRLSAGQVVMRVNSLWGRHSWTQTCAPRVTWPKVGSKNILGCTWPMNEEKKTLFLGSVMIAINQIILLVSVQLNFFIVYIWRHSHIVCLWNLSPSLNFTASVLKSINKNKYLTPEICRCQ